MIAENLASVRCSIERAARRAGREPDDVALVAVSKGRTVGAIREAYDAGQRIFGESRPQELAAKQPELPSDTEWHFIGPLQRNKVRLVRPIATLLHSLDRVELGMAWLKGPGVPPPVLVQVNISRDPAKQGFEPEAVEQAVDDFASLGLDVRGLMTIPALTDDHEATQGWFRELAGLVERLGESRPRLRTVSMGMTDDYELAVEAGSTVVRVGRAIFGSSD